MCKFYGGKHGVAWHEADVVVTTPGTTPPKEEIKAGFKVPCYRLILDESHLYEKGADPKLPCTKLFDRPDLFGHVHYSPTNIWCVTGTPFSNSLGQLEWQARILGHWDNGYRLRDLVQQCNTSKSGQSWYGNGNAATNQEVADKFKKLMIRHSKSQRIQGEEALSLPDSDVATVWLDMSPDEKLLYDLAGCADGSPKYAADRVSTPSLICSSHAWSFHLAGGPTSTACNPRRSPT